MPKLYQLPDNPTYGDDAGKWLVVSDDGHKELTKPMYKSDARVFLALLEEMVLREARRLEILDFLQDEIGTGFHCDECGMDTCHALGYECAECGRPFPFIDIIAFKLHASITDNEEYINRARAAYPAAMGESENYACYVCERKTSRHMLASCDRDDCPLPEMDRPYG